MARKRLDETTCPVARTLDRVGGWWSMLVLRDALHGATRFDQFQKSLGVAPNILTARLAELVEAGFLEKRPYSERPLRYDYVATPLARDFKPVLQAFAAFGQRHFGEGATCMVDAESGADLDVMLVDRKSGRPMDEVSASLA
jgi:DNA-binding HxlR family transcriptional regulator